MTGPGACRLARWEAPRITVSRAPGTLLAISAPCAGGAAGSSLAAMTRVGAVIEPSTGRRSIAAIASQQPA